MDGACQKRTRSQFTLRYEKQVPPRFEPTCATCHVRRKTVPYFDKCSSTSDISSFPNPPRLEAMLGLGAGCLHQNVDLSRHHRRRVAPIIIIVVLIGPGEGRRCSIRAPPSSPSLVPFPPRCVGTRHPAATYANSESYLYEFWSSFAPSEPTQPFPIRRMTLWSGGCTLHIPC